MMDPHIVDLILGLAWPFVMLVAIVLAFILAVIIQSCHQKQKVSLQPQRQGEERPTAQDAGDRVETINSQLNHNTLYKALTQLVIHAESISWNRFYAFLLSNSIFLVGWATLFQVKGQYLDLHLQCVQIGICIFGAVLALLWLPFGVRSRRYLDFYIDEAKKLESTSPIQPFTQQEAKIPFTGLERIIHSNTLFRIIPFFFFLGYLFLLYFFHGIPDWFFGVGLLIGAVFLIYEDKYLKRFFV